MPSEPKDILIRLQSVGSLPTLPGVVHKLVSIVEEDHVSTQDLARLISSDQVITSRVLKIVNSAFYGFPGRITTITHALVLLGFNVVKGVVLSAAVVDMMTAGMVGFWEHSLGVAAASGHLARRLGEADPEEASVAGLLHDLGKVILCTNMRDILDETRARRDADNLSFLEAERATMGGLSHAEIGAWIAKEWNLPVRLREAMAHHHAPLRAQFEPRIAAIVHVADALARGLEFGSGGDPFVPAIDPAVFDQLGLGWDGLTDAIDQVAQTLEEVDPGEFTR